MLFKTQTRLGWLFGGCSISRMSPHVSLQTSTGEYFPFSKNHHNFRKSPQRSGSRGRPREHVRPSFQGVLPGRGAWRAGGEGGSLELEPGGVQRRWMPAPGVCHFVSGVRHKDGQSKSFSQVGLQWSCQSCSLLVSVGKAKFLVRSPNLCCRADLL